jgi:hypothetical protein
LCPKLYQIQNFIIKIYKNVTKDFFKQFNLVCSSFSELPTNITVLPQIPITIQTINQTPSTPTLTTMTTPTIVKPEVQMVPSPKPKKEKLPTKPKEDIIANSVVQQSNVASKHAQQQLVQENEQFASAWLRATLEPTQPLGSKVEQQEIYKLYITASSKIGRRGVCSPMHFPRIVRTVFGGSVGPNAQKIEQGGTEITQYYYEGLKMRARPLTVVQKGGTTVLLVLKIQITEFSNCLHFHNFRLHNRALRVRQR